MRPKCRVLSLRDTDMDRDWQALTSMVSSLSLSVVPDIVAPSQGRKKRTLLSLVLGTIRPIFAGE